LPFFIIPTNNQYSLLSDAVFSGGLKLVSDYSPNKNILLTLNIGGKFRPSVIYINDDRSKEYVELQNQLIYGLGFTYLNVGINKLNLSLNLKGYLDSLSGLTASNVSSPMESLAVIEYEVLQDVKTSAGAGVGSRSLSIENRCKCKPSSPFTFGSWSDCNAILTYRQTT